MPACATHSCSSSKSSHPGPVRRRVPGFQLAALGLVVVGLAGCAGSVAPPTVVTPLSSEQRASLRVAGVTTEAAQGVAMAAADTDRISQFVLADIQAAAPGLVDPAAMQGKTVRIVVTRYDAGSAGARFMLAGLGQIRLDADVFFVDKATGRTVAEYKVAKQFALGGIYGAVTNMQDVEKGFAKSVAALVKPGA